MRQEDKVCVEIYYLLRNRYKDLSMNVGEYSNVLGVFFHEIMIYTTNYYLLKNSIGEYNQSITFPYLNTNFVKNPFIISFDEKKYVNQRPNPFYRLAKLFKKSSLTYYYNYFYLYFLQNFSNLLNKRKPLISLPNKQRFDILKIALTNNIAILNTKPLLYLIEQRYQLEYLEETLFEIFKLLNEEEKIIEILIKSFKNYVESYLTDKPQIFNHSVFLSNCNAILANRIYSSMFNFNNRKVIAFSHGFSSFSDFDEPIFGYGELTYSDYYVDFGTKNNFEFSEFQKPLHKNFPLIYKINCITAEKVYKNKLVKHVSMDKNTKILYIPNAFIGNQRYGPFRDIEDEIYLKWQKALLSLNYNIFYKSHPFSIIYKNFNPPKVVKGKLEDVINNFDVVILDFMGSAFALATASDKPMVYFNLGLRRMRDKILTVFKERVFWYDIDINEDFMFQINQSLEDYNLRHQDKFNNFTEISSLNPNPRANQKDVISDIISSLNNT